MGLVGNVGAQSFGGLPRRTENVAFFDSFFRLASNIDK
jgi:hypothetical protein